MAVNVTAAAGAGWTIAFGTSSFEGNIDPRDLTGPNWSRNKIETTNNNCTASASSGTLYPTFMPAGVLEGAEISFMTAIAPENYDNTAAEGLPVVFAEEVITLTSPDGNTTIVFTGFIMSDSWQWPMKEDMKSEITVCISGKPVITYTAP